MSKLVLRPPHWASYWGEDKHGPWVSLVYDGVEQRFRWIAPGEFLMGSPEDEPEREERETQHLVRLTEGYWLADTACTQALWQAVMGQNPSEFQAENRPVEDVSWHDTQTFLDTLNKELAAQVFRLPTEAEWEYACRAGTTTPFFFGDSIHSDQVNFNGNYPYTNNPKSAYRETTVPVKSLPCNAWGLYEMHGNVYEWCSDRYAPYETTENVVLNPQGPDEGGRRVLRGGSWIFSAQLCRSAYRVHYSPELRYGSIGFRLASGHQLAGSGTPLGMEAEAESAGKPKGQGQHRR